MSSSEKNWKREEVRDDETITSYEASKKCQIGTFLPMRNYQRDNGRIEKSVYRTDGLENGEIFELGFEYVKPTIRSRGDLKVSDLRNIEITNEKREIVGTYDLYVEPDGIPHERHANILGWPDFGNCEREREEHRKIAAVLKKRANCVKLKK